MRSCKPMDICILESVRFLTQEQEQGLAAAATATAPMTATVWRVEEQLSVQREPKLDLSWSWRLGWAPHSMATPISAEAIEPTKIAILAAA